MSSENSTKWEFYDSRHELGLRTGIVTKIEPPLPVITEDDFVITDNQTVITDDATVITDNETVITPQLTVITDLRTVITPQMTVITETPFDYGDRLIKALKQDFQRESDNLRTGNGVVETIMERITTKQYEFEEMIRKVRITPKLRREITKWLEVEYYPYVDKFKRPKVQLELGDWRELTYQKRVAA